MRFNYYTISFYASPPSDQLIAQDHRSYHRTHQGEGDDQDGRLHLLQRGGIHHQKKSDSDADNVPVSVSEDDEAQMKSEDEQKDLKAVPAPTIEGEVPFVSPPVNDNDKEDDDNDDDDADTDEEDDNNDDKEEDDNNNGKEDVCDFNLNDVKGISEYAVLYLQKIHRNNAKLVSLGLLGGMTSAASPSTDRTNRKKRVATQGDFWKEDSTKTQCI